MSKPLSLARLVSDLLSSASGKGATLVGFIQSGTGAVARTVESKLTDIRTFEDFGAVGDVQDVTNALNATGGAATDDTAAVQAAINWAYAGGTSQPRAIHMTAKYFLVGALDLYPTVTIIGTGRMTSGFACKTGTTGKWISDRGNGGQKLMLSGFAAYGRGNLALTHILEVGNVGVQFGTQGVIRDLWLRDAPNAYAYEIDANVGFIEGLVGEDCRHGGKIIGNANMCRGLYSMQAGQGTTGAIAGGPANIVGLELYGCHLDQCEIEAPVTGSLPLLINGDTHVGSVHLGAANGTTFSHLIEVDVSTYTGDWSVKNLQILNGPSITVSNGVYKVGATYRGGTAAATASARDQVNGLNVYGGALMVKHQRVQAFNVQLATDGAGVLQHKIGSSGSSGVAGSFTSRINGASVTLNNTPTSSGAFVAGGSVTATGSQFVLDVDEQTAADAILMATIVYNSSGTALTVNPVFTSVAIGGVTKTRLMLDIRNAATAASFNVTAMGASKIVEIQVLAFLA